MNCIKKIFLTYNFTVPIVAQELPTNSIILLLFKKIFNLCIVSVFTVFLLSEAQAEIYTANSIEEINNTLLELLEKRNAQKNANNFTS